MNAPTDRPPRMLVIGAHPDDCEYKAGGLAALYRQAGHDVCFVSVTNGQSGHQTRYGPELAAQRRAEAAASGRVVGLDYRVLDYVDGDLQPTLEARREIIRLIRRYDPDLVLTHRPNDYHPDHRITSLLVSDASYLLTVPAIAPDAPALSRMPVIMYLSDEFQRPYPFSPSVVVDIEPVLESVVEMLACHRSQFFDWLPYNRGELDRVPSGLDRQGQWLRDWYLSLIEPLADRYREPIVAVYGAARGQEIRYIEAFETCEYGAPLTPELQQRLFPFLPDRGERG
jgi:LmbE family N-acetylglucosaminyl deacetylase